MAQPGGDWRAQMSGDDRVRIREHITAKLMTFYSSVPEATIQARSSAFESQVYATAASRQDYLQRIAAGLTDVQRSVDDLLAWPGGPGLP